MNAVIGLITDFGSRGSHFIAAIKNVIKSINANANIFDISHEIKPFSIIEANFILFYAIRDFPSDSII
ncbi:MAG: SAM-dependent chlorinase/fluorinase, partial [Promethearchaeota archaeon]